MVVGASVSEPHISVTSLRRACVSMLACLDLANTVNFKSANFPCTCTIIFKFNNELLYTHLDTPDARNSR